MRAVPQPLIRTDTRLDLALDLKQSPSPMTPRANGLAWLNPPDENIEPKRTLKRTESLGKTRPAGRENALAPTVSIWGEDYVKTRELVRSHRDVLKPVSVPVFSQHEDDDNVCLDIDALGVVRKDNEGYVGSYLDETHMAKPEPVLSEIIPHIEMLIEGGRHLELWDAKPDLCARVSGCVSLSRKTMRTIVDGRAVEIVLRGIAVTASTVENPRRCENNHFDSAHPEWHVGGLSGGQQVPGRAVWFGNGVTGTALSPARARMEEFNVPFHIDIPMGLVQSRRDRVIVIGASAIFGSTHRPDVVRRVETEILRLTVSNLQSNDAQIPMWR